MKKEVLLIILLLIPLSYALNMGTVKGYVLDTSQVRQTGASISIVVEGCSGSGCTSSGTTDANGFYIKTNLKLAPGDTVNVSATKGTASGLNQSIATGSGQVGVATINVTICTPPGVPTLSAVADTHDNSLITMTWTSGTGATYDAFMFDSEALVSPATSPQTKTNVAYTSHTWKVKSCNAWCCSAFSTDTFIVTNSASSAPVLTDQPHTQTIPSLRWTNSTDPDGDATYNKLQIGTDVDYTTIIEADNTADSPYTPVNLTTFTMYYWRVRTCDSIGSCSGWDNDSFFYYSCPACSETVVGGGGRRTVYENVSVECSPDWNCGDWSICNSNGLSTRLCSDVSRCVPSLPKEFQFCTFQGAKPEQPKPPAVEMPAGTTLLVTQVKEQIEKGSYLFYLLWLIIIALLIIVIYQQKKYVMREIKIDKKLEAYVSDALKNGFTEDDIREKLIENSIPEIEIDYIFKHINK